MAVTLLLLARQPNIPAPLAGPALLNNAPRPPARRPWWILLVLGLLLLAWTLLQRTPHPQPPPPRSIVAQPGRIEKSLRLTGILTSRNVANLSTPRLRGSRTHTSGASDFRLNIQHLVKPGAHLRAGDTVAVFDPQYMAMRVDDFRADVEQRRAINAMLDARTDLRREALEQQIKSALALLNKAVLDLRTAPVRSAMQTERFRLRQDESRARLGLLEVQRKFFDASERAQLRREQLLLKEAELELRRTERNLDRMVVKAPIDGILVMSQIQRGTEMHEIEAGDDVHPGYAFAQIVDLASMMVEAVANQNDAQHLRIGMPARVHFDAMPGLDTTGRVVAVGAYAWGNRYRPDWVRRLTVRIALDPRRGQHFIPNLSVSADALMEAVSAPVALPRECLLDGAVWVRTASEDGDSWVRREVRTGLANNTHVAILAGLAPGERVACEPPPALAEK